MAKKSENLPVTAPAADTDFAAFARPQGTSPETYTDVMLEIDAIVKRSVEAFVAAVSDETTALEVGTGKLTFRLPFAMRVTDVRISVTTAPTGAALQVDINDDGVSILGTVVSIDAGEKTSTTAATAFDFAGSPTPAFVDIADDSEITVDIDQIGSTIAGAGLKLTLIGNRT